MPEKNPNYDGSARQRHYKGQWADELKKNTTRNLWKGKDDLRRLSKGISENLESNYKRDEEGVSISRYKNDSEYKFTLIPDDSICSTIQQKIVKTTCILQQPLW